MTYKTAWKLSSDYLTHVKFYVIGKGSEYTSENFNIFYKEPFDDNERCNWYGKDGNTGPTYSCNQTGQIVAIRRWDGITLSVCSIEVYGGNK